MFCKNGYTPLDTKTTDTTTEDFFDILITMLFYPPYHFSYHTTSSVLPHLGKKKKKKRTHASSPLHIYIYIYIVGANLYLCTFNQ